MLSLYMLTYSKMFHTKCVDTFTLYAYTDKRFQMAHKILLLFVTKQKPSQHSKQIICINYFTTIKDALQHKISGPIHTNIANILPVYPTAIEAFYCDVLMNGNL